jgi:3-isopropylmalate/(R)-2-methylmalate dehydratase small subunit
MMEPMRMIRSRTVVIAKDNIDTDQIIPARFLKVTDKKGLGKVLFSDWRYAEGGAPRPEFVLNQPTAQGCQILVAGDNFGCGSSREHAPWALVDAGFRAVVSTSIADIFRNNALKNGLVPVVVDRASHAALVASPGAEVEVDIEARTITVPGAGKASFPIDGFARYCLLNGVDELGYLLSQEEAIAQYEGAH